MPVHGRIRSPAPEWRVALHGLEELRQEEDRSEHPEAEEHGGHVHRSEGAVPEQAQRQHRVGRSEAPTRRNAASPTAPPANDASTSVLVQPCALPCDQPEDHAKQTDADKDRTPKIEARRPAAGFGELPPGQGHQDHADRARSARRCTATPIRW